MRKAHEKLKMELGKVKVRALKRASGTLRSADQAELALFCGVRWGRQVILCGLFFLWFVGEGGSCSGFTTF